MIKNFYKKDTVNVHGKECGKILVYQNYQSHLKLKHSNENCKSLKGKNNKFIEEMFEGHQQGSFQQIF